MSELGHSKLCSYVHCNSIVGKFLKISSIWPPVLIAEYFIHEFLSHVDDYIEDMATFTTLAKLHSTEYLLIRS